MKITMKSLLAVIIVALLGVAPATRAQDDKPLKVVASFSILGDMVKNIGGKAIDLTVLAGPDADMHTFQPTPAQVKAIAEADIIAINGLGLDRWMQPLIESSGTHAKLLVASAGVKARFFGEDVRQTVDPHAWQNITFGRIYIRNIANALIGAAPEHGAMFRENMIKYDAELKKMDANIRDAFKNIPPEKRKIITSHDAFGYFGEAYDITFLAPQGLSTEAEPSAQAVAKLINQIKEEKVSTVFIENLSDPRLMEQIADETGARMGGTLYSDALSPPSGPAPTYLGIFKNNVPKMREAMERNGD